MLSEGNKMLKIGITGGIGSGKSTVCKIFEKYGVPVLHSDKIAKELSNTNPVIRRELINLLGKESYGADGTINRNWLAAKIFSDKKSRRKVESIIHPFVARERERLMSDLRRHGNSLVMLESAILFESGIYREVDTIVAVDADDPLRFDRVCRRDSVSVESVKARDDAQLNSKEKAKKADYVIYNNGTLEELESKVRFLYNIFTQIIKKD
jgi:dephospho-CoA kinase